MQMETVYIKAQEIQITNTMVYTMKYVRYVVSVMLLLVFSNTYLLAQVNKELDWHYLEEMEYQNGVLSPAFGLDPNGWFTAGANSKLEPDEYGDVFFESVGANADQYFGLAERNFQQRTQESEFALRFTTSGHVMIYAHGSSKGYYGTYDETTKFKISKKDDGVYFYKQLTSDPDYVLMDTVSQSSFKGLWPFTIMRGNAYGFDNMSTNFPDTHTPVMWDSHETAGTDVFTNITEAYFLAKSTSSWKGKGLLSVQEITIGEEGTITIPSVELSNGEFMLGVSDSESIDSNHGVKYGFQLDDSNNLSVFCNGVEEYIQTINTSSEDKARMIFQESQLLFYYGDSLLHTESLIVDNKTYRIALIFDKKDQIIRNITTSIPFRNPQWSAENNINYIHEPRSFYKDGSGAVGWNSGTVSSGISYGNEKEVWVESVFIDDKIKFFGFTRDESIPDSYADFYYGMQLSNSGRNVEIYEINDQGQVSRLSANVSSWEQYDTYGYKLKMHLKNDSIRFYANDIHLSTRAIGTQHPLMRSKVNCGAMIYSPGGQIRDFRYGTENIQEWHRGVDWYVTDGVDYSNSKWSKSSSLASGWGNSLLVSRKHEHAQDDFRIEFSDLYDVGSLAFGLSSNNYPTTLSLLDYGFEINDQDTLSLYAGGNKEFTYGIISPADKCWIEFDGSFAMFGVNDKYVWGKVTSSPVDFYLIQMLNSVGAHSVSVKTTTRDVLEDSYFWEPADIHFTSGEWESRTTNAGMISSNYLREGENGYTRFDDIELVDTVYMGISNEHDITKISDINYGFYKSGLALRVIEQGDIKADLKGLNASDELFLEKEGNTIRYYVNDLQVYHTQMIKDYNWYVGCFTPTDQTNIPDASVNFLASEPEWITTSNIIHSSIKKSLTQIDLDGDDDGIVVSQLPYDKDHDHYLEFRVNGAQSGSTEKVSVGYILESDYDSLSDVSSDSLRIELRFSNKAMLYSEGNLVHDFGTYSAADVFRIEKKAGVLSASMNGATPVTSPGVVCCSFYPIVQGLDVDGGVSTVTEPTPTSVGYSTEEDGYAVPKRKLDGAFHLAKGKLFFRYEEHYEVSDLSDLQYKIYDKENQELYVGCMPVQATALGDNHFVIDFTDDTIDTCAPDLEVDGGSYYVLEITNRKEHMRYIRFLYKKPFTSLPN